LRVTPSSSQYRHILRDLDTIPYGFLSVPCLVKQRAVFLIAFQFRRLLMWIGAVVMVLHYFFAAYIVLDYVLTVLILISGTRAGQNLYFGTCPFLLSLLPEFFTKRKLTPRRNTKGSRWFFHAVASGEKRHWPVNSRLLSCWSWPKYCGGSHAAKAFISPLPLGNTTRSDGQEFENALLHLTQAYCCHSLYRCASFLIRN
jgi:hypothetical protein